VPCRCEEASQFVYIHVALSLTLSHSISLSHSLTLSESVLLSFSCCLLGSFNVVDHLVCTSAPSLPSCQTPRVWLTRFLRSRPLAMSSPAWFENEEDMFRARLKRYYFSLSLLALVYHQILESSTASSHALKRQSTFKRRLQYAEQSNTLLDAASCRASWMIVSPLTPAV